MQAQTVGRITGFIPQNHVNHGSTRRKHVGQRWKLQWLW